MKSILSLLMVLSCTLILNAQINFEGSNDYGRLYDVTYDLNTQNKVYALSLGNHLVMSEDNGQNWEVIYSFPANGPSLGGLRTLGDDSLSFHVQNSYNANENTIYILDIATEEIIIQFNPPVSEGATKSWVGSYSIYENDVDVVLFEQGYKIGTAVYSKVYYTNDGGITWTEIYDHLNNDEIFPNNVAISPNDPQTIFILRGVGPNSVIGGLFVSNDAGATWTEKEAGQAFRSIAFNPENPATILLGTASTSSTTVQNLYKSTDNGDAWGIVPISWDDYFLDPINYIAYDANDANNIIVLEGNEIVISADGGTTWTNYIYGEEPGSYYYGLKASYNPFQSGEVQITTDFYPVISTDGGATVSQLGNPMFNSNYVGISTEGDGHLYYGVQRGLLHKNMTTMTETSNYVEPINFFFSDPAPKFSIDSNIEGRVYLFSDSFTGQYLWVSNEHGGNISQLKFTEFDQFYSVTTDPTNFNKIWASYQNEGTIKIDFTDVNNPIVASVTMPSSEPHIATFIDSSNSDRVIASLGGAVFESTDDGVSWANISDGLTLDPQVDYIFDIQQNPNNSDEFVIGTTQGVFKSEDGAQTWSQSYTGSNVRKVKYSTVVENHVAISIPSAEFVQAQVVYTVDNGAEWILVPFEAIEYTGSSSMDFVFHENSITAFLSTYDLGVITYEIDTTTLSNPNFENNANHMIVYPNPTNSIINVELKDGETANKITIFSYTGQKINEVSDMRTINLENLSKGIYFVKVQGSNGGNYVKKIIKE